MEDEFREVLRRTGSHIEAIRVVREKFAVSLECAKEVMLRAEGIANSLDQHQARLADDLKEVLSEVTDDAHVSDTRGDIT